MRRFPRDKDNTCVIVQVSSPSACKKHLTSGRTLCPDTATNTGWRTAGRAARRLFWPSAYRAKKMIRSFLMNLWPSQKKEQTKRRVIYILRFAKMLRATEGRRTTHGATKK